MLPEIAAISKNYYSGNDNIPAEDAQPNILIVDDRRENLLATEKILRKLDATIFKASSGNEALSMLLRHRFAIVLLDVQMPKMDGFETAMLMQEHESMKGVPIVFFTAISKEEKYATQAAEIGAVDYIFKPIDPDILRSKVKVYLDLFIHREQILRLNRELEHTNKELEHYYTISLQAQKMEALGQLTGGIAHDFNNLLAIILGNLDFLHERTGEDDPLREFITPSIAATEHGMELTQQLLAFSRKQVLQPKVIEVNTLLHYFTTLMRHTLGERIKVVLQLGPDLWNIKVDAGQLQGALINLSVNARDAMQGDGKLIFETQNVYLDDAYAANNAEVIPGNYVMISVTDTGEGMSQDVIQKAFDPFFTTKEVGKGTGLGLSMVYGFVKQSAGHIKIESEPGNGTSIKIYLPKTEETDASEEKNASHVSHKRATTDKKAQVILVVEDNENVLKITSLMVKSFGYEVITAESGDTAMGILKMRPDIDLLLTDIILPGTLNGHALAKSATRLYPQLKVIFNSGYAEQSVLQSGMFEEGAHLIKKPFRRLQLANKIAEVLGNTPFTEQ